MIEISTFVRIGERRSTSIGSFGANNCSVVRWLL